MTRKKPIDQQVIVVGGGSYGLGRAIARAAAERGAKVVVGARTRDALDGALADIARAGSEGIAVETDVADRRQVQALVDAALERLGQHHERAEAAAIAGQLVRAAARRSRRPRALRRRLARDHRLDVAEVAAGVDRSRVCIGYDGATSGPFGPLPH